MKTLYISLVSTLVAIILLAGNAQAQQSSQWQLKIESNLDDHTAAFTAGVSSTASDNYEVHADVLSPPPPPGSNIQISTFVNQKALAKDMRALLKKNMPKKWEITLTAFDYEGRGITGANTLNWDISSIPSHLKLKLIDYGEDAKRENIQSAIELQEHSLYTFQITNAAGTYRYIDLIAETSKEEQENEESSMEENFSAIPPQNNPTSSSSQQSSSSSSSSQSSSSSRSFSSRSPSSQLPSSPSNTSSPSQQLSSKKELSKPAPITGAAIKEQTQNNASSNGMFFVLATSIILGIVLLYLLIIIVRHYHTKL